MCTAHITSSATWVTLTAVTWPDYMRYSFCLNILGACFSSLFALLFQLLGFSPFLFDHLPGKFIILWQLRQVSLMSYLHFKWRIRRLVDWMADHFHKLHIVVESIWWNECHLISFDFSAQVLLCAWCANWMREFRFAHAPKKRKQKMKTNVETKRNPWRILQSSILGRVTVYFSRREAVRCNRMNCKFDLVFARSCAFLLHTYKRARACSLVCVLSKRDT